MHLKAFWIRLKEVWHSVCRCPFKVFVIWHAFSMILRWLTRIRGVIENNWGLLVDVIYFENIVSMWWRFVWVCMYDLKTFKRELNQFIEHFLLHSCLPTKISIILQKSYVVVHTTHTAYTIIQRKRKWKFRVCTGKRLISFIIT